MSGVEYIKTNPTFVDEGVSLLLDQFSNSPNIQKVLEIALSGEKEFQELLVAIAEETLLTNAVGTQLDEIGTQMGVRRLTDDDNKYRTAIRLAGLRRTHKITKEGILSLLRQVVGDHEAEMYTGLNHVVEITLQADCYDDNVSDTQDLKEIMPLNTNLRILKAEGALMGFEGSPARNLGLASVSNREVGGGLPSITFRTDTRG